MNHMRNYVDLKKKVDLGVYDSLRNCLLDNKLSRTYAKNYICMCSKHQTVDNLLRPERCML